VGLEDRIRELCAEVVATHEGQLDPVIGELKAALHEHTEHLRKLAAQALVGESAATGGSQ
jgi:hypothetical protein